MQLSDRSSQEYQWQTYKQQELLPISLPNPSASTLKFRLGLGMAWRTLVTLLVDELVDQEQQVEYLERCWTSEFGNEAPSPASTLQRLWTLMN
jgi:hypothetical protein